MMRTISRRRWLGRVALGTSAWLTGLGGHRRWCAAGTDTVQGARLAADTRDFLGRCRRDDGGYAPSPDPSYAGNSDTKLSDLAAVTYVAVLARTMGWELPQAGRSVEFIARHQKPDGRFVNLGGAMDPASDLAVLYNTTQGVVALRALGAAPRFDPSGVVERLVAGDAFKALPWYTTSFFPLFYAALGRPFPDEMLRKLARHMEASQAEDGYLGDHVAATFHMAHFFRLIGQPTPGADRMVARVLRDQKPDGGWDIKEPDWDVHAGFDAVFILRQLGGDAAPVRAAIDRAADWALDCRNADGGFGHFRGRHSDVDAVYFQFGTLIQAGRVPGARLGLPDAQTLGWGHAMQPGREYPGVPPAPS
jgi:geranylgeranyl transferase type-2 subunit beta